MSEEKKGFFSRLVEGLTKTRNNIMSGFDAIFSGFSNIDEDFYEELEEVLVMADLGIHTTENIIEELKRKVKEQHIKHASSCWQIRSKNRCVSMRKLISLSIRHPWYWSSVSMASARQQPSANLRDSTKRQARKLFLLQQIHSEQRPLNS